LAKIARHKKQLINQIRLQLQ